MAASLNMSLFRRVFRPASPPAADTPRADVSPAEESRPGTTGDGGWYVPRDGNRNRFAGSHGTPPLHLILYRDSFGEQVLRLCEDATGLLVGPSDMRLASVGIYVSQLRGEWYHQAACEAGDFRPGQPVTLIREPVNEFDAHAVAVYDATGQHLAAYVNKQKARMLARLIDSGEQIDAISLRGTGPGVPCDAVAILAAAPDVLRRLQQPRPTTLPRPAHQRR